MDFKDYITIVEDFPKAGISFKDITPLLRDGDAFKRACHELAEFAKSVNANVIVGPESRGFIFGCPIATELNVGFVPIRKPGKLPREEVKIDYDLEYGSNTLCMHKDALKPGDRVVIIDDLLATGGTIGATVKLINSVGAQVVGAGFIVELDGLNGREKLEGIEIKSLVHYMF